MMAGELETQLKIWTVLDPGQWPENEGPKGWWFAVHDGERAVAYFRDIRSARRFRLAEVNRIMNG
jgi:hypothetical protein